MSYVHKIVDFYELSDICDIRRWVGVWSYELVGIWVAKAPLRE